MKIRLRHRAGNRGFASVIFLAVTFITFACAADNTQNQQAASSAQSASKPAIRENAADALYSIECGQANDAGEPFCYVDGDTYIGWRTFHGFCHVCHAQDAVGSTFAPNLLDRMSDMDMDLFVERVNEGFTGQVGVMPPWKDDPNVNKRYKELYAYLSARASGDLPPGRPKKKPKSN
jgi:mono/diheme cytochrome c family protein